MDKKRSPEIVILVVIVAAAIFVFATYTPSYEPVEGRVVERIVQTRTEAKIVVKVAVPTEVTRSYLVIDSGSSEDSMDQQRIEVSSGIYASCWEGLYFHRDSDGSISCDTEPG